MKKALITGITGQDGAYLAKLLLDKGYKARKELKWKPTINLKKLVKLMVDHDLDVTKKLP